MSRILAQATVDKLRSGPVPLWEVRVNGLAPYEHERTYQIERKTDGDAAWEGIRLFTDEVEALIDAESMSSLVAGMDLT